jgi:hypothetical protein
MAFLTCHLEAGTKRVKEVSKRESVIAFTGYINKAVVCLRSNNVGQDNEEGLNICVRDQTHLHVNFTRTEE